jgi:hypothetical protein
LAFNEGIRYSDSATAWAIRGSNPDTSKTFSFSPEIQGQLCVPPNGDPLVSSGSKAAGA